MNLSKMKGAFMQNHLGYSMKKILIASILLIVPNVVLAETKPTSQSIKRDGFSFRIGQQPSWIAPMRDSAAPIKKNASLYFAYIDEQIRLDKNSADFYRHAMRVVAQSAALDSASQVLAEFDPKYQELIFHRLGIWRGDRYIDKLNKKQISLLQRETQLENRIYDGQVTASVLIDDVRVGDRIEYSYTIRGYNPVFENKFVYTAWMLAESGPVDQFRVRLLAPSSRPILHKSGSTIKVIEGNTNGMHETVFIRENVPQANFDSTTTSYTYLDEAIQFSEFADWHEVAIWGDKLFKSDFRKHSPAVRRKAAAIKDTTQNTEERVRLALDFVQNEVRYFGLEMGANSHRPSSPEQVITQRFGDCKDKVSLLIGLLNELGVEVLPALVSTRYLGQIDTILPSPLAFDHVIARVNLGGRIYWLDGTRSLQKGRLENRQSRGFEKGLVLNTESTKLAELPTNYDEERVLVEETFHIEKFSESPIIESKITYFGEFAEFIRNRSNTQALSQLEEDQVSYYARMYPGIKSVGNLKLIEVPDKNAVTLFQQYMIPKYWRLSEQGHLVGTIGLWALGEAVNRPFDSNRRVTFRINYPGIHRHNVNFEYPEKVTTNSSSSRFDDSDKHYNFSVSYDSSPTGAQIKSEMRLLKNAVAPEDWSTYAEKLMKASQNFDAHVSVSSIGVNRAEQLKKELKDTEEKIRSGGYVTKIQVSAKYKVTTLTAQLESNRLPPDLRSEILRKRGIEYDNLEMLELAAKDFDEAIRLDSTEIKNFHAAAVNAFARGKDDFAKKYIEEALTLQPASNLLLSARAYHSYFQENYSLSRTSLLQILNQSNEAEKSYPALWLYLATVRSGGNGVETVRTFLPMNNTPNWPYPVLKMYMGLQDFEQTFKDAKEDRDVGRLCELYFYAGEKALLEGDKQTAKEYFTEAVNTGVREYNEYTMAKRRLNDMDSIH
jgi:lipoprotein NlpI/transglutaminase-like putative cysteine protease